MANIIVKIVRVPGAVTEVGLQSGATVGDALRAAGISPGAGESLSLNGQKVDTGAGVSDGARVIISKEAKGN